jgi:Transposase
VRSGPKPVLRGASNRKHAVCVLDGKGEILMQESITNSRGSLTALSRRYPGALMVMEVGMHSPWASRFLKDLGHRVLVANPRKVRAIYQNIRKSDRRDAEMLARISRTDEKLLYPVEHVSEEDERSRHPFQRRKKESPRSGSVQQAETHQPAISFSISIQNHFNRAGGRTSNVEKITLTTCCECNTLLP